MFEAVIFDLDDTLISEFDYIKSGYKHISNIIEKKYGINHSEAYNKLMHYFENGTKMVFNSVLEYYQISYSEEDIKNMVFQYRSHEPDISFFQDVMPFIDFLRKKNIKIGIITDGYSVSQRKKLEALDAYHLFDEIIISDDIGAEFWKPHPKVFEIMCSKLCVDYDKVMYIGDNPSKDFYIATLYPIKCVRIHRKNCLYNHNDYYKGQREYLSVNSLINLQGDCFHASLFICD